MASKPGTLLTDVSDFSPDAADHLAELWITTAEEFVSAAEQTNGRTSLAQYLGLDVDAVNSLLTTVQAVLPEGVAFDGENIRVALGALPVTDVVSFEDEPVSFVDLPPEVNLLAQMPPVRDQGDRGTCVAYAVTAVREYLLGAQSTDADLSEQYLYWACKERDGYAGEGTWIETAVDALHDLGVCPELIWPYSRAVVFGNEGQGPPPAGAATAATPYRISSFTQLNATWVDSMRAALAAASPVIFAVDLFESCQRPYTFRSGDLRLPLPGEAFLGGHAMCMVGYVDDTQAPGGGYFIVRNSWGEACGYDGEVAPGYCRLPYNYLRKYGTEAYTVALE